MLIYSFCYFKYANLCFHCCNNSCLHKFIAISATDGFNFPISLYDPIHLIYLILCCIWDKVLIPGCWIFTFWWGQFWYQDFGEICYICACIQYIYNFNTIYLHFLFMSLNIHSILTKNLCLVSPKIFVVSTQVALYW